MSAKNAVKSDTNKHLDYADAKASIDETYLHLKEAGASAKQAAYAAGSCTTDKAKDQFQVGKEKMNDFALEAGNVMRKKPLAVAGAAFAAGFLISYLLKKD